MVTGDDESEVSIKEAAEAVMKAMDYDGEMVVSLYWGYIKSVFSLVKFVYLTARKQLMFRRNVTLLIQKCLIGNFKPFSSLLLNGSNPFQDMALGLLLTDYITGSIYWP